MKKASTTLIGAFILGACVLFIAGVVVFGSINFLNPRPVGMAFFPGNVSGLNVGAPVNLRGVQIGTVTKINVEVDPQKYIARIPVYMEFEPERMVVIGAAASRFKAGSGEALRGAIKRGLTAQLVSQSMVTGQLQIDLDFKPGRDASTSDVDASAPVPVIPTVPSEIAQLKEALSHLPIDALVASLVRVTDHADHLLTSPQFPELLTSFVTAGRNANELLDGIESKIDPMTASVTEASSAARATLQEAQQTLGAMRTTLASTDEILRTNVRMTLRAAEAAMQQATVTLGGADSVVAAGSQQRADINQTLHNLSTASQSLRMLTGELERRPNAILMGK